MKTINVIKFSKFMSIVFLTCILSACEKTEFPDPPSTQDYNQGSTNNQNNNSNNTNTGNTCGFSANCPSSYFGCNVTLYTHLKINGQTLFASGTLTMHYYNLPYGTYQWTAYQSTVANGPYNCGKTWSGTVVINSGFYHLTLN